MVRPHAAHHQNEFSRSGSDQNPDLTGRSVRGVLGRVRPGAPAPVEALRQRGADFVTATDLPTLVAKMNGLTETPLVRLETVVREVAARERETDNPFTKDHGGGMPGYRSLEGTFLGGCLFSGRTAGRAVAQETA